MDRVFKRQLERLKYIEPEDLLGPIVPLVEGILQKPETVQHLSAREKSALLEKHQAGYLALLMKRNSERLGVQVRVAYGEIGDCDAVIRAVAPQRPVSYKLVQLKQLPSEEVCAHIKLQAIIDGLRGKYRDPDNLVVAVWINRNIRLDFAELDFSGLEIEQLWFFGDAVSGELVLQGGQIADLAGGWRWVSRLRGVDLDIRPIPFKPLHTA